MGAKKTPNPINDLPAHKKLSKDSATKKFVKATSNNKKTSLAPIKKTQTASDLKKNKSRDNSNDNGNKKQSVNNKKPLNVADEAKSFIDTADVAKKDAEKCNKNLESSTKVLKKIKNVRKF